MQACDPATRMPVRTHQLKPTAWRGAAEAATTAVAAHAAAALPPQKVFHATHAAGKCENTHVVLYQPGQREIVE